MQTDPIRIGDRQLADIIRRRRRDLTAHVIEGLTGSIPRYGEMPDEAVADDLTAAVDRGIRLYLTVLADDREPTELELAEIVDSAAERAEEGFSIEEVLAAYVYGVQLATERLIEEFGAADGRDAMRTSVRSLAFVRTISDALLHREGEDARAVLDARLQADHELLLALLADAVDEGVLARSGRVPAPAQIVLRLAVATHVDEDAGGGRAAIAGRRKLRRLRDAVTARFGDETLSALATTGGVVLIGTDTPLGDGDLRRRLAPSIEALASAAGSAVTASAAAVPTGATAAAGRLTEELLDLAGRLGRGPGLHLLEDLALEHQLTRPGPARRQIAAVLTPIAEHPELIETLRWYLASDRNRRRTALDLGVHPNTVDHRIRRVTDATGGTFDPFRLAAALLAHDAEHADP